MRRAYVLRIFLNDGQPNVVTEGRLARSRSSSRFAASGSTEGGDAWSWGPTGGAWPTMRPQHGPGWKHRRTIALEPWQDVLVAAHPGQFVRGCIHSDGCRHRRVV